MQPYRLIRMKKRAIELGEHNIVYKPRYSINSQALEDFLT